jgi:DNA-binding SARP family transcriptional activator
MTATLISSLLPCSELTEGPAVILLGGPYVVTGGARREVPQGSKRLLVFTALSTRRVDRRQVAGALWPSGSDQRAIGNLRSALWRLKGAGIDLIDSDNVSLGLRTGTVVDMRIVLDWAARLIDGSADLADLSPVHWPADAMELLPGWYDDWIIFERERIRQRLLHALEALSRRLIAVGRHADAVDAAISAVSIDPLRESASRILIEAHLAEDNIVEGRRAYNRYSDTLHRELGIAPSQQLTAIVRAACESRLAAITG